MESLYLLKDSSPGGFHNSEMTSKVYGLFDMSEMGVKYQKSLRKIFVTNYVPILQQKYSIKNITSNCNIWDMYV